DCRRCREPDVGGSIRRPRRISDELQVRQAFRLPTGWVTAAGQRRNRTGFPYRSLVIGTVAGEDGPMSTEYADAPGDTDLTGPAAQVSRGMTQGDEASEPTLVASAESSEATEVVGAAVALARETQTWWADIGFSGRRHLLDRWRNDITDNIDDLASVVRRETGKPHGDAVLEIALTIEHLAWAAKHARKVLGRRRVGSTLLTAHLAATVEYLPFGVVGVIGPWNYPVYTP